MRSISMSLLILFLVTVASGQVQQGKLKQHPSLRIVDFQWLAAEGYSFPDWGEGVSHNGGIFPSTSNWGVASGGSKSGSTVARARTPFFCKATISLNNSGSKTIRRVHLDYIFRDLNTGEEFLRYQFYTNQEIQPGRTKSVEQRIYENRGKYRKHLVPTQPERTVVLRTQQASRAVAIRRIEYADGSIEQY